MRSVLLLFVLPLAASCAPAQNLAPGSSAVPLVDPAALSAATAMQPSYTIGQGDVLRVNVFQVPDLSVEAAAVDASGQVSLPLLGSVDAAGLTTNEFAARIQSDLRRSYLQDPRVSVAVTQSASRKITVDGAVEDPGVFEMRGRTTLVQAVAMAKGVERIADTRRVAVFRTVDQQPMVAVFDLAAIRAGQMPDPVMEGDDIIVVDTSRLSVFYTDAIQVLPTLGVFAAYQ